MNIEKAEKEVKALLDSGLDFKYDFNTRASDVVNLSINVEGRSMKDIISKLKEGEIISFLINDGQTWNGKSENDCKFLYDEKYDNSIYWENTFYGDGVRVSSNMGSLKEWIHGKAVPEIEDPLKEKKLSYNIVRTKVDVQMPIVCHYTYKFTSNQWLENIDSHEYLGIDHDSIKQMFVDSLIMEFKHALNNVVFGDPAGKEYVNSIKNKEEV